MKLSEQTLQQIELETRKRFPNEMCGLVLKDGKFLPLTNMSDKPEINFVIPITDFFLNREDTKYIIHSHTKTNLLKDIRTPSLTDIDLYEKYNIDLAICGFDGHIYYPPVFIPSELNPEYLGRKYIYGVQDCGFLARDFYYYNFGIEFTMNPRWSLASKKEWTNAINNFIQANNLRKLEENEGRKFGDIMLVDLGFGRDNHAVIYIDNTLILNQGEYSAYEPLENWEYKSSATFRHMSL